MPLRETSGMALSVLGAEWLILGQAEPIAPILLALATGASILVWRRYQRRQTKQ